MSRNACCVISRKAEGKRTRFKVETKLFLRKLRKLQRRLRTRDRSSQRKEQPKVTNIISIQVIEIVHIHSNINISFEVALWMFD